jgi:hypothetical protein
MRRDRLCPALASIAVITTISSLALILTATSRREERLMMATYFQQKEAEALVAAREERYIADLAEGKVRSPILPFLNPIGMPEPHRVAAAADDARAVEYGRIARKYDDAAARPWRPVDLSVRRP